VILANPPFMSPKGGIKPHTRFSVQSKRSEVLFVDYMAEHLNANGRAGIIVPEGVIFQGQGAYVALRKMLVESSLVAVVSLPAGVFNPYSGVKTSILILDKSIARLRVGCSAPRNCKERSPTSPDRTPHLPGGTAQQSCHR
jgi:type I restriction enzyme M protein